MQHPTGRGTLSPTFRILITRFLEIPGFLTTVQFWTVPPLLPLLRDLLTHTHRTPSHGACAVVPSKSSTDESVVMLLLYYDGGCCCKIDDSMSHIRTG